MTQYDKVNMDGVIVRFLNFDKNFEGKNYLSEAAVIMNKNLQVYFLFLTNTWEKLPVIIISELVLAVQNLTYILSWKPWLIMSERVLTTALFGAWKEQSFFHSSAYLQSCELPPGDSRVPRHPRGKGAPKDEESHKKKMLIGLCSKNRFLYLKKCLKARLLIK